MSQGAILIVTLIDACALLASVGKFALALPYDTQVALLHSCCESVFLMAIVREVQVSASRLVITQQRQDDERIPNMFSLQLEPELPSGFKERLCVPPGE